MARRIIEARLVSLSHFDELSDSAAEAIVRPSCASERWVAYVVRKRPYHSLSRLVAASDEAIRMLDWPDIEQAMPHRVDGGQAGEASAGSSPTPSDGGRLDPDIRVQFKAASAEYEERFGHSFLICEAGRSSADVLGQLRLRLAHSPEVERRVVRAELLKVVRLRLAHTFQPADPA